MPTTPDGFTKRLAQLRADLVDQGSRVRALIEAAFDAAFARDAALAREVIARDDVIDRVDIEIERAAVRLLADATEGGCCLDLEQLRAVLTVVKVNNEFERIADAGVAVCELVKSMATLPSSPPDTFRVLTNSVAGILRDCGTALARSDGALAKVVLTSEATVAQFKNSLLRDIESSVARGAMSVDMAFTLHEIATHCVMMADHCTNVAEQVLYLATGTIYRHMGGKWERIELPT